MTEVTDYTVMGAIVNTQTVSGKMWRNRPNVGIRPVRKGLDKRAQIESYGNKYKGKEAQS